MRFASNQPRAESDLGSGSLGDSKNHQDLFAAERILIVDDESRIRASVGEILTAAGYEICLAENGKEAISLLGARRLGLVLLDLDMPDISGQQVLDFIQAKNIDTSVVILSGDSSFDQATRVMRKGAEDFLAKPCSPEQLLETVSRTLQKRQRKNSYLQIQQQIQDSEELHRFIVNHSPDLIFMLDASGHFCFINECSEHFLGVSPEEVLGRHFSDFFLKDDHFKAKQAFLAKQDDSGPGLGVELRLISAHGRGVHHVEIWSLPVALAAPDACIPSRDAQGRPAGRYVIARDIDDRKQAEELRLYHLFHDQLTNLPNRALLNDRLQVAIRQAKRLNQKLAVMFLDIDRFKLINDNLGHLAGDEMLQIVAQKLKSCLREGDTLARISGDEFNLLLPNISGSDDAAVIARKIQDAFSRPLSVQGQEARVSFSIGFAVYPEHGQNKDLLLRNADAALYRVKETGRNAFLCYSPKIGRFNGHHLDIENSLHRALENEELRLFYQPQVDMRSKKVLGLEALIRWEHPQRGLLLPGEFIAIAEQSKLICAIGEWVLHQVCKDALALKERGHADLQMAINVSPQHLEMEGFAQSVLGTVRQYCLESPFLEIEITENSLMHDMHNSRKILSSLAEEGVTITVDDFGTGYSSLSYLQNLPLHTIKIDRSFVKNLTTAGTPNGNETVISAILAITKGMNLNFIAEGIESQYQHDYLLEMGCSVAQGFFYSRPLPFSQLITFLGGHSSESATAKPV